MRTTGLLILGMLVVAGAARAELPPDCRVAESLIENDFPLRQVTRAIANKKLTILVVGAGSSTIPNDAARAYPARLEAALVERLPSVNVKVVTDVKAGRTAADALKAVLGGVKAQKPALLIWQAGTVDAMRQVDLDQFSAALDRGIEAAQAAGADTILVNAQYSPRTESMIALGSYAENMRWAALRREIPLFDRFSIMKLWSELGTFNFTTAPNKLDMAERVHDCIGRLLADAVVRGGPTIGAPPQGTR